MHTHRYAVVFAGQGSQAKAMMHDFVGNAVFERTLEEASDTLGFSMQALFNDELDGKSLNATEFTQPAILTASLAIWRIVAADLPKPVAMAGHSLGEYSALCAAGVIEFADALNLVHARGQFMQQAVANIDTKMAAILGLDDDTVAKLCAHANQTATVAPANFNSAGQVVIAGLASGVNLVMDEVKSLGKKAVPLAVSVPSHTPLMAEAGEKLEALLAKTAFSAPKIEVIQNVDAQIYHNPRDIKEALKQQLSLPVQWTKTMDKLAAKHTQFLLECSFGNVLGNLAKRQTMPIVAYSLDKPEKIDKALRLFLV